MRSSRRGGGADLEGRRLTLKREFHDANPRRPHTHGWVALEVLRRAPGCTLTFEEYRHRLFNPSDEILALSAGVEGRSAAFADLKHIRCDIYRRVVTVDPPLDEFWYQTNRCSAGTNPYRRSTNDVS